MKRKLIITFIALIAGCSITNAQILNSYSHSKITQKKDIPFKYFFYAAAEGGYWTNDDEDAVCLNLSVGFKYRISSSKFFVGASIIGGHFFETYENHVSVGPTISYIRNVSSITENSLDVTLGVGVGYGYAHTTVVPELNLTYWFSRIGVGLIVREHLTVGYMSDTITSLMGRIAVRF